MATRPLPNRASLLGRLIFISIHSFLIQLLQTNEYTALWNSMLQEDGHEVQLERVRFKAGKSPWVGTRSTYKKIYKFL